MPHTTSVGRSLAFLITALLLVLPASAAQQEGSGPAFTDISTDAGIALGGVLTESLAWGDYDEDGDPDLYFTNNAPNALFRNEGAGSFSDATASAGVGHAGWGVGTAFADLDDDGDLDLFVVNFQQQDVLYRNDGLASQYAFTDVALSAGINVTSTSRGMAYVDYNRDGRLDIYCNAIGPNVLYENQGGMLFVNVAATLGVDANDQGVGTVCTDIDDDGWIDIFTGNRSFNPNRLYRNRGGSFVDITASAGITQSGLGMGVHAFDHDNDLDMDLYWTTWPTAENALYENNGDLGFLETAGASGTTDPLGWGISNNAGDIDNDGFQDFFVTNGFDASSTANVLFHNDGAGGFTDVTSSLQGGALFDGRGAAFADIDGDGDLDLCVTSSAGNRLWRNDTSNGNHQVTFDLAGVTSNRSAVGARIEIAAGSLRAVQEVSSGAGRGSFNDLPVEFGLGTETSIQRVIIRWPDGTLQVLENPPVDQVVSVLEEDVWFDLGRDKPGTGGKRPRLAGAGSPTPGGIATLALRDGLPGAAAFLIAGLSTINVPFEGGTLVPAPDAILFVGQVGANGTLDLTAAWPAVLVSGTTVFLHEWLTDPGATFGLSASNALRVDVP